MSEFLKTLEEVGNNVRFVVGLQGLQTSVDVVMSEYQWQDSDLPANMTWEHVTVSSSEDKDAWIAAKNRWLAAAWTPNQSDDDRRENAQTMRDAEAEMAELEARVK